MLASTRISPRLLLPGLLLAAGCSRPGPIKTTVTVVYPGGPVASDPHLHREMTTRSILSNVYQGLVGLNRDMGVMPLLAESWENLDERTWRFNLREGVAFSNGLPLTAESAVAALARARRHPGSQVDAQLGDVDTVLAVGPRTLELRTKLPDPLLLKRLSRVSLVSYPRIPVRTGNGCDSMLGGTGPYRCLYWGGDSVVMERDPGYWAAHAGPDRLRFIFEPDQGRASELVASGEADIIAEVTPAVARASSQGAEYLVVRELGLVVRYLRLSPASKQFTKAAVRRAVSLSLDRRKLVDSVALGYGHPATQMVSPAVFGFSPDLPPLECDTTEARELLRRAGYPAGLELDLDVTEARRGLGEMIARQMGRSGFKVNVRVHSKREFFTGTAPSHFILSGLAATSGDASDLVGGIGDVPASELAAASSLKIETRQRALQRLMGRLADNRHYVPLFVEENLYLVSSRIEWRPRLDMMVLGREITVRRTPEKKPELR